MTPQEREQSISELMGAKIGETDAIARLIQEHHNPLDIAFGRELPPETTEGGGGGGLKPSGLRGFGFTEEAVAIDSGLNRIKIGETLDRIIGKPVKETRESALQNIISRHVAETVTKRIMENMPMHADGAMNPQSFEYGGPGSGPQGGRQPDKDMGAGISLPDESNPGIQDLYSKLPTVADEGSDAVSEYVLNNAAEYGNLKSGEIFGMAQAYKKDIEQEPAGTMGPDYNYVINIIKGLEDAGQYLEDAERGYGNSNPRI